VLDYKAMADDGSMLNTPPTFGWYFAGLVFKWLKRQGGLPPWASAIAPRPSCCTRHRRLGFYRNPVAPGLPLVDERAVHAGGAGARQDLPRRGAAGGPVNLEGHRSVGGMRASLYNAMPLEACRRWSNSCASSRAGTAEARSACHGISILTLNNISVRGLERLPRERYEVASEIGNPHAVLLRSADMHGHEHPASVLAVARAGAGTNNIPVAELSKRGVPVFNAPAPTPTPSRNWCWRAVPRRAQHLPGLGLRARSSRATTRAIDEAVEKGKKNFVGFELPGRTLGVIGLGAIGVEVANSAQALGMKVLGYDPQITVQRAWQLSSSVQQALSLDDLFARSDIVSVHVPLLDAPPAAWSTAARLKLMRPGGVVLNFARAPIVDEARVVAALDSGHLHAYICDFPDRAEGAPRAVTLPHLGASTGEAEENCAVMAADTLRDFLENGNIRNSSTSPKRCCRACRARHGSRSPTATCPTWWARSRPAWQRRAQHRRPAEQVARRVAYTLIDADGGRRGNS
jgi:D-3-phosphoglycerate dehydrogenase